MSLTDYVPVASNIGTALIGASSGWLIARFTRKSSITAHALESRRDTIADREQLIKTILDRLEAAEKTITEQGDTIRTQGEEIKHVVDRNNQLITYIYRTAAVMRRHELIDKMPQPAPDGIHL